MSISSIASSVASQAAYQPQPAQQTRVGKDSDGDEATESASAKAAERLSPNSSIPTNPGTTSAPTSSNTGSIVNVVA